MEELIKSILASGDGSQDRPYIVNSIDEEYLILHHLNKSLQMQSLTGSSGKPMDLMECDDGTSIYFDISAFFGK